MRKNPVILRGVALLLMLVFIQKAGGGLFLHNLVHGSYSKAKADHRDEKNFNLKCTCGDDFLLPFSAAEETTCVLPPVTCTSQYYPLFETGAPSRSTEFTSLRGPPAFTV